MKRSRSQLFLILSIRFGGATALTETIRWTPIKIRMESGDGLHASTVLKELSRFFSVEAVGVALPNLRQTLRGRERSKRGYALYIRARSRSTMASAQSYRFVKVRMMSVTMSHVLSCVVHRGLPAEIRIPTGYW